MPMSKLLIVEESTILCGIFKRLLEQDGGFNFDIAQNYKTAKEFLSKYRYEFSVVSRTLPDASHGEIIALLNKHNVSPIVYTTEIDESFVESFESASIVEYILRHRYDNVKYVLSRLNRLKANKQITVIVAHKSEIFRRYIKQNLALHNFKVIMVDSAYEALQKIKIHNDVALVIVNKELEQVHGMDKVDGLELVRRIKELKRENLKIIALADESNSYQTSFFLNQGADDYLINQFSRDEFYVRIYQNLQC
jgi:putative two-component system response regulator